MRVNARRGFARAILVSGRTPAWDQADADFHATHKTCEMCGSPQGTLNVPGAQLDGPGGDQCYLEAHDILPYHLMTPEQQNDYTFILSNFIMLHHFEHHRIAHCCDPYCLAYDPNIRDVAAAVLAAKANCTKKK